MCIRDRGIQSDGGTFHFSRLNAFLENGQLDVPPACNIPGTEILLPYVLVADEPYPLKTNIMRRSAKRWVRAATQAVASKVD